MRKICALALLVTVTLLFAGCNGDGHSISKKEVDKSTVIDLPQGRRFIGFSADKYSNYIAHRERHTGEEPEEYEVDTIFRDGLYEKYIVREH